MALLASQQASGRRRKTKSAGTSSRGRKGKGLIALLGIGGSAAAATIINRRKSSQIGSNGHIDGISTAGITPDPTARTIDTTQAGERIPAHSR